MMTLDDALIDMAQRFGLDADALIQYSYEDDHSGWDGGVGEWPVGSLWTVEGRVLYALTRAIKPDVVIEIGTNVGCSTSHFASALKANGQGKVISFDTADVIAIPGLTQTYPQGGLIPNDLREFVELVNGNGLDFLEESIGEVGIIYEDCDHATISTQRAWVAGKEKLISGGMLISHDAAHWLVGEAIRQGIINAGIDAAVYAIRPSDCGLAAWRKPMAHVDPEPESIHTAVIPDSIQAFIPVDEPDFEDMTVAELRDYASDYAIELGDARRKAEIIAILREA